ncbi:tripartite tricarboxylate transporter substrate binding protein [Nocardioides sp. NPDC087217]|uniref:tripartite tricarboxylate transporter substrate binding protein n=1 Tax=Nocardioides sp. NPDC087217 TaxID=3364335 RepID=UPI0037F97229
MLAESLESKLDKDVQVLNLDGAAGMQMINKLLSAPTDGCTIAHSSVPGHLQYLFPELKLDYKKDDFSFAGAFAKSPQLLTVAADSPYKTVDDLVASAGPDGLTVAADGPKGGDAALNAQFSESAGVKIKQVVLDGGSDKLAALLGGQVDYQNGSIGSVGPSIKSGDLRALAVWGTERIEALPDVPTGEELGLDVELTPTYGLMVSAETPEAIRKELETTLHEITEDPEFLEGMKKLGLPVEFLDGEEYSQRWDETGDQVTSVDYSSLR